MQLGARCGALWPLPAEEGNWRRLRKWIARRLRVLHTRTRTNATCAVYSPLPAKGTHWRRAKRTRESSFFSPRDPPPPAKRKGGRGRIPREICTFCLLGGANWRRGSRALWPPCRDDDDPSLSEARRDGEDDRAEQKAALAAINPHLLQVRSSPPASASFFP